MTEKHTRKILSCKGYSFTNANQGIRPSPGGSVVQRAVEIPSRAADLHAELAGIEPEPSPNSAREEREGGDSLQGHERVAEASAHEPKREKRHAKISREVRPEPEIVIRRISSEGDCHAWGEGEREKHGSRLGGAFGLPECALARKEYQGEKKEPGFRHTHTSHRPGLASAPDLVAWVQVRVRRVCTVPA